MQNSRDQWARKETKNSTGNLGSIILKSGAFLRRILGYMNKHIEKKETRVLLAGFYAKSSSYRREMEIEISSGNNHYKKLCLSLNFLNKT